MVKRNSNKGKRNPSIRITQDDVSEHARLVRNSKAKISRTKKNYGIDLSNEVDLPSLESFQTRKEYNEWRDKLQSFTNRHNQRYQFVKNKHGIVATQSELTKIELANAREIRIAEKIINEAKKKPFIQGGEVQGTQEQRMLQMGRPNAGGINKPKKFDFNKMRTRRDLEKRKERAEERGSVRYYNKRMEKMKSSFIDQLNEAFNSDADSLVDKIKRMPAQDFYEMYLQFDEFDFNIFYPTDGIDDDGSHLRQVRQMEGYADDYFQGKIDMDFRGF
jgi:hypothetical protein